ncbi:MAG: type II toxin-antitoxin system Phd/YefM family antitoxin [Candidatus Aminicenantes bacterium]|nr:type II toxin-antitoxin system Phd/YefM family antitoxin [Candidatus Aminicenantes bacterium]
MKASVLDLRRRMKDVLNSLKRNEPVTLLRRGKVVGTIHPPEAAPASGSDRRASAHAAFGMWKDRPDLKDVEAAVERLRGGRFNAL